MNLPKTVTAAISILHAAPICKKAFGLYHKTEETSGSY